MSIPICKLWEQVKENYKRLKNCPLHDFEITDKRTAVCKKCKGTISKINYLWYKRGLEDGNRL